MTEDKQVSGPDLKSGVEFAKLTENEPFLGHYEGEAAILVGRPSDSLSADSSFHVGVSPADRASTFGIGTDVFH